MKSQQVALTLSFIFKGPKSIAFKEINLKDSRKYSYDNTR